MFCDAEPDGEGLPIVFLAAMACGTAVIGTRAEPKIIVDGETGLVLERNQPGEMAAALRRMLTDPDARAGIARSSQQLVAAHFSWRSAVAQFEHLYCECLGQEANADTSKKTVSEHRNCLA